MDSEIFSSSTITLILTDVLEPDCIFRAFRRTRYNIETHFCSLLETI